MWAESQPVTGWDKAVLWHLGDGHRLDTGISNLTPAAISRRLGCSTKRVRTALKKHMAAGLISGRRRWQAPTEYTLHFDGGCLVPASNELDPVGKSIRPSDVDVSSTSPRPSEVDVSCERIGPRGAKKTVQTHEGVEPTAPGRVRRAARRTAPDPELQKSPPIAARASAALGAAPAHGTEHAPHEARHAGTPGQTAADLMEALVRDVNRSPSRVVH